MDYLILTWEEVYNLTLRLSERVVESGFKPDVVVGIARGGWIPARVLSDVLYADSLHNIRIEYYSDVGQKGREPKITQPITGAMDGKAILLVDEVADTGDSLYYAIEHVKSLGAGEVKTAVLHWKPWSRIKPDYYMVQTESWTVYPWELRESIIAIVKAFKKENPALDMAEIRRKLVFDVGFEPTVADYFIKRL